MSDDRDICNAVRRPGRGGEWFLRLHLADVTFESTTEIQGNSKEQRQIAYELRDQVRERIAGEALRTLAFNLADSTARSDIECHTVPASGDGLPPPESRARYYDTSTADGEDKQYVAEALEYLQLRGLLDRHPEQPHLVRFKPTT